MNQYIPVPGKRQVREKMTRSLQHAAGYFMDSILAQEYTPETTEEKAILSGLLDALLDGYMHYYRPREMGEKEMSEATGISIEKLNAFLLHEEMFGPSRGIH